MHERAPQDSNYNYQQFCDIEMLNQAVSLVGCFDQFVSYFLCGLSITRKGPDWSESAISGNLFYGSNGRLLVPAIPDQDGDGLGTEEVRCYDPLDCSSKCLRLKRTAREGTGSPAACQLCDLPCPVRGAHRTRPRTPAPRSRRTARAPARRTTC